MGMWGVEGQCEGAEAGPGAWGPSPGRGTDAQMDCGTGREEETGAAWKAQEEKLGTSYLGHLLTNCCSCCGAHPPPT